MTTTNQTPSEADARIVRQYFARDEAAIRETERRYGRICLKVAQDILGNHADAEECVSDAYLRLWDSIPPQNPQSLCAYACRIVRNLALNRLRDGRALKRNRDLTVSLDELVDCMPVAEEHSAELSEALSAFLRTLEPTDRRLFLGRYWYAMRVKDLAAEWGMKPDAVSGSLRRTRNALKRYLEERGFTV